MCTITETTDKINEKADLQHQGFLLLGDVQFSDVAEEMEVQISLPLCGLDLEVYF